MDFIRLPKPVVYPEATQADGIQLCKELHAVLAPQYFPALTGGLLYKDGKRKDIDIVIYRNRENAPTETYEFTDLLEQAGVEIRSFHGFVTKAVWKGFSVDIFNPESQGGDEY